MLEVVIQDRGNPGSRSACSPGKLRVRDLPPMRDVLQSLQQHVLNLPFFSRDVTALAPAIKNAASRWTTHHPVVRVARADARDRSAGQRARGPRAGWVVRRRRMWGK